MPVKVCRNTAQEIRRWVKITLEVLPNVPPEIVQNMRTAAKRDEDIHEKEDKYFIMGNGPAAERKG